MNTIERPLSPRQKQILEMAAEGRTDKEIAVMIGLAEGTIRTYWDRMRNRYNARSRAEVVAKALIRPEAPDLKRYMLMKMPLFIWTALPSGYVDFCNEWFSTCGGLDPDQALGRGCRALMPEGELEGSAARWASAQKTGNSYEALVHFYCGPSRELRQHKIRVMPLRDRDGVVYKWVGYGRELADNADEQMAKFLRAILI